MKTNIVQTKFNPIPESITKNWVSENLPHNDTLNQRNKHTNHKLQIKSKHKN